MYIKHSLLGGGVVHAKQMVRGTMLASDRPLLFAILFNFLERSKSNPKSTPAKLMATFSDKKD